MQEWFRLQKFSLLFFSALFCAMGMGLYFSINFEPNLFFLVGIFLVGFLALFLARKYKILIPIIFSLVGFGYAGIYTHIKNTPLLTHSVHNVELSGTIQDIDYKPEKTVLVLSTNNYGNIKVSGRDIPNVNIGDKITGHGGLFKPQPAPMPETFDMARHAYFNNLSATGYISNVVTDAATNKNNILTLRNNIHKNAKSFLTDTLVLGYKNAMEKSHRAIWATNGISHIWSISGYHMALLGGWFFVIFYMIFRTCPYLVRRIPARIPALVCTSITLMIYLVISGGGVATIRAFIMALLVMIAFIVGRNSISLRSASIAFLLLIIINPYYVMQAGFQLSFAAIFGIIWLWSEVKPKTPTNKILKYIYALSITALIATVFTMPFIIAHFNSLPVYGVISNIVMVPIFSFVIMPLVILGTILAVFGIHYILDVAHYAYDILFHYATSISNLPQSNISITNIPNIALIMVIFGLGFLIFIRNDEKIKSVILRHSNILLSAIFICLGIAFWQFSEKPLFYISNDHNLIAFVKNKELFFNKDHDSGNYFAFDAWKKSSGEQPESKTRKLKSEHGVHTIKTPKWTLVYIQRFVPLAKNIQNFCNSDDINFIASYYDITSTHCDSKIIHGGAIIFPNGKIRNAISNRLWHNPPEQNKAQTQVP